MKSLKNDMIVILSIVENAELKICDSALSLFVGHVWVALLVFISLPFANEINPPMNVVDYVLSIKKCPKTIGIQNFWYIDSKLQKGLW